MQEASYILKKYWGHSSFRPLQQEIIDATCQGIDCIALLPTGGGKSLCFQIPSLLKDGICIVISPLAALMEDQVNSLQQKGIKAISLSAGIPFAEIDTLLDNCIYGNYKFLYLSPERLQQDLVKERIKQMNVNFIAVDEAHCISQWGQDFRPAYRSISLLREIKPEATVLALTASATPLVVVDIQNQLKLTSPKIFKKSLFRKNIAFGVLTAEDKMYRVRELLKNKTESAIIYVRSRKATSEIVRELDYYQISAQAFHGGLSKKEKQETFQKWLTGKVLVMVATNAFGMGIDKPDVRKVIHLNLPESIESYFQEAGRAGRDDSPAQAVIITNKSDVPILKNQFLNTLPDLNFTILVYKKLLTNFGVAFGEGLNKAFDFNFGEFCSRYKLNSLKTYNTLQMLDRLSVLKLTEQYQKSASLQFVISNKQLLVYLGNHAKYDAVVKPILRTYGGIFENKIPVNLHEISKKSGFSVEDIVLILKLLEQDKIIDLEYRQNDASITFLVPREDESTIYPFSKFIKEQAKNKENKIDSLLAYVENDQICKNIQLLSYFGEKNVQKCGICSVCLKEENRITNREITKIYKELVLELERGAQTSRELAEKLLFPEAHILATLQIMLEKDILELNSSKAYKLKHI